MHPIMSGKADMKLHTSWLKKDEAGNCLNIVGKHLQAGCRGAGKEVQIFHKSSVAADCGNAKYQI